MTSFRWARACSTKAAGIVSPRKLQRPDLGRARRPAGRRRRGRLAAGTPLGEGEELAERLARFIAGETELLLDLQAQFHAVEAVQAELIEPYLRPHFSVG